MQRHHYLLPALQGGAGGGSFFSPNVAVKEIHAGDEEEVGKNPGYGVAPADTQPAYGGNQPDADTGTGYHLHHTGKDGEVAVA